MIHKVSQGPRALRRRRQQACARWKGVNSRNEPQLVVAAQHGRRTSSGEEQSMGTSTGDGSADDNVRMDGKFSAAMVWCSRGRRHEDVC